MRIFLAGGGDPIPLEAMPDLTDENALTLIFTEDDVFNPADFAGLGFTHYEIMCVGGAGGRAGKSNFVHSGTNLKYEIFSMGGSGGGGGLEVVSGALEDLPDTYPIVVGAAGTDGADGVYSYGAYGGSDGQGTLDPGDPGTDGGASTFGGTLCRASGGKGGGAPPGLNNRSPGGPNQAIRTVWTGSQWDTEIRAGGNGGQGGIGGQTTAGGGAEGGKSFPGGYHAASGNHANTPQTFAVPENGSWDGHIGEGGGGGMGGSFGLESTTLQFAV